MMDRNVIAAFVHMPPRVPAGRRGDRLLTSMRQDLRFATRIFRRRWVFSTVTVLLLGLGIGSTTAVVSVIDRVLLAPPPFQDPGTLVSFWPTRPEWRGIPALDAFADRGVISFPEYRRIEEENTHFQGVAVYGRQRMTFTGLGEPEELEVGFGSASLFRVLGVRMTLGRGFAPGEDGLGAQRVVILSHNVWRRRFGSGADVLGTTITLDGHPYTVIGVLPAGFRLRNLLLPAYVGSDALAEQALWVPTGHDGSGVSGGDSEYEVIARLSPGVTVDQARPEVQTLLAPDQDPARTPVRMERRQDAETARYRAPVYLLLGAAAVLLLLACSNVATLFISEASMRRKEFSIRMALGAGTKRIIRQLLTESVFLALLGSVLGVALAYLGTSVCLSAVTTLPGMQDVEVSGWALLFAVAASGLTGSLFGTLPSLLTSWSPASLAAGTQSRTVTLRGGTAQRLLVSFQVALTVVLLVGGALLTESLAKMNAVNPGFDSNGIAAIRVSLPADRYAEAQALNSFYEEVLGRIRAIPGVVSAAGTVGLPFSGLGQAVNTFRIEGRDAEPGTGVPLEARRTCVLPGFHETLGIPLFRGRTFTDADGLGAPRVTVVSEAMAHRFWPGEDPIGSGVWYRGNVYTVVGIVGDVRHTSLEDELEPTYYIPNAQAPEHAMTLVAKANSDPSNLFPLLREVVWAVDDRVPITLERTLSSLIAQSTGDARYRAFLLSIFAITATAIAAAGVAGITARVVSHRRRELGIRMAIGADRANLLGLLLRSSLLNAVAGTGVGLLGAFWASRVLARFLFGVSHSDPRTYGAVAATVLMLSLVSCYLPARRIRDIDPMETIRAE